MMVLLSWACVIVGALMLSYGVLLAQQAIAQPSSPDWMGWIGFSGILAIGGMLMQWGKWKGQMSDTATKLDKLGDEVAKAIPRAEVTDALHRLEDKMDGRFDKLENAVQALFGRLGAERRTGSRQ